MRCQNTRQVSDPPSRVAGEASSTFGSRVSRKAGDYRHIISTSFLTSQVVQFSRQRIRAGVLQHLRKHYSMDQIEFIGASAGALSATIAACNIDPKLAVDTAYRISEDADLFNKRLGLMGIWGGLIRQWLEELLPEDAHIVSRGRLRIVVQDVWRWRPKVLQDFNNREDLISANMSSIHLPVFLDFKPFTYHRGRACMDADLVNNLSILGFGRRAYMSLISRGGRSFLLNHVRDTELVFSRLDMLKVRSYESVMDLMYQGRKYAMRLEAEEGFDSFLGGARRAAGSQKPNLHAEMSIKAK